MTDADRIADLTIRNRELEDRLRAVVTERLCRDFRTVVEAVEGRRIVMNDLLTVVSAERVRAIFAKV